MYSGRAKVKKLLFKKLESTLTFKLTLKLQLTLTQLPLSLPVCMAQVGVNDAESIGRWSSILHTDYTHNWEVE